MGRPRKDETLSLKEQQEEVTNAPEETIEAKPTVVLDRVALGIAHDKNKGHFLVEIPFNSDGTVGELKVMSEADGADVIKERFRIAAATKIL